MNTANLSSDRLEASIYSGMMIPGGKRGIEVCRAIAARSRRLSRKLHVDIFEELLLFLANTERAFLKIRSTSHLVRIVGTLLYLREKQALQRLSSHNRAVICRLFRSKLLFDFGQRDVVCITVSISSLHARERFDASHMLRACRDVVPTLDLVPHSFISIYHPEDKTISFYGEVECKEGNRLSASDIIILKNDLQARLEASIERVDHHLDLPQNDEDMIRNSVLLSQQLQAVEDPPQMIVQFQGQTNHELEFLITYMHVVCSDKKNCRPKITNQALVKFEFVSSYISGSIGQHVKQVHVFKVRCAKDPFFRLDHSIDFLKAREFVTHCVDEAFGKVRDLNGGLICQQYDLLNKTKKMLSSSDRRGEFLLEEFFYSLCPSSMKSLLEPHHVISAFNLLLILRAKSSSFLVSEYLRQETRKELYIGFICPESLQGEEIFRAARTLNIKEHEIVLSRIAVDGRKVCIILLLTSDEKSRASFLSWLETAFEEAKSKVSEQQVLRLSFSRPTLILDPRVGTDFISGIVIKQLYEGLMRLDPTGTPTLAGAKHVEISDDGLQYTFTLRPQVWSNGKPVTAYDFEYAWKKVLDPSFTTLFDYLFFSIKNARAVKQGDLLPNALGVHVIDSHTLVVELEHPSPCFLELCCLWIYSPLCREMDRLKPGWAMYAGESYVCNGPFKLSECDPKSQIQLVKNDQYWDRDHVAIDRIEISIIEDIETAFRLFTKGDLDWIGEPMNEVPLELFLQSGLKIESQPIAGVLWLALNVHNPLFSSKKIRHAFSLALNRQKIIQNCLYGDERPSHSILPASLSLLTSDAPLPYDVDRARRLFDEGLLEIGLTRQSMPELSLLVQDREPHKSVALEAVRYWQSAFHISTRIDLVEKEHFLRESAQHRHDISLTVWSAWYKDALYTLDVLKYDSNRIKPSNWTNPDLCRILEQSEMASDKVVREQMLQRAEEFVMDEMPVIPVYDYTRRFMKSDALQGAALPMFGTIDFKWAHIKREGTGV